MALGLSRQEVLEEISVRFRARLVVGVSGCGIGVSTATVEERQELLPRRRQWSRFRQGQLDVVEPLAGLKQADLTSHRGSVTGRGRLLEEVDGLIVLLIQQVVDVFLVGLE